MNIKKYAKENYKNILINIGIYLLMIILIMPIVLDRGIGNLDELWNYNFARNIADGLIPYRDFNMVQTPLLPIIAGNILKIFSNELIVMRILSIILNATILFVMYKLLNKIGINKKITILVLLFWLIIIKEHICIDYNYCTLLITLIIMYIEISNNKKLEKNYKKDILVGLLAGTTILFKQTTGIIISIVVLFYNLLLIRNKEEAKVFAKKFIIRMMFIIIPVIIMLLYLGFNGALSDFIDYTILGIATFSNKISYLNLIKSEKFIIQILSIIMPIILLFSYIYSTVKNKKKLNILVSYSIGMFSVAFPISDEIHFLIGITPAIIVLTYLIYKLCIKIKNKFSDKKSKILLYLNIFINTFIELICIVYISLYAMNSILFITQYISDTKDCAYLKHYKYIEMSEGQKTLIENVESYIILNNNNKVYILDSDASLYMIPLDIYNKDFDMFLKGNLGSNGEEKQIEKIKNMDKNTKILIKNDNYNRNWQNPNNVTNYIKNNLEKIGEIEYFDIYVK